jgi:hypothetical protein
MRKLFIEELIKQAEKNKKIILIVGDLGYGVIEQAWPDWLLVLL